MLPVSPKLSSQSGISVVETLVVCVVIAIVASLALMQRGSANEQFQRQNASRELKVAFERARFDSVKRRALDTSPDYRAYVQVQAGGFVLRTFNDAIAEDKNYGVPVGITIEANTGSLDRTVYFNQRGEAQATGGAEKVFLVCNGPCNTAAANEKDVVLVTPTGTVNLLIGGTVPTPFPAPVVTSVSNTDAIDPYVVMP